MSNYKNIGFDNFISYDEADKQHKEKRKQTLIFTPYVSNNSATVHPYSNLTAQQQIIYREIKDWDKYIGKKK